MNSVKRTAVFLIFLVLFGSFGAQQLLNAEEAQRAKELYQGKIVIGITNWPGYVPLIVARDKGYFKEAGLDVEIKFYPGLLELSKDYVAGNMQGRANLTLDAIKEYFDGFDQQVVLTIDYSQGADAIFARKGIETVKDFRGRRVAYEPETLEEFFLTWVLLENEMTLADIIPVHADPEESAKQLAAGKVDVAVSYEPYISQYLATPDFHPVYSSADAPGLISDILTFRTDFIRSQPETVETLIRVYFKGLEFWKKHPSEANALTAKAYQDTAEGIANQLKGLKLLDERDNAAAFTFAAGFRSIYGNLRQIGKFILKYQKPKREGILNTDNLINRSFIKKISGETLPKDV